MLFRSLVFLLGLATFSPALPPQAAFPPAVADSTDITVLVRSITDSLPQPGSNFRKGHVTPKTLTDYLRPAENGYRIQLPHHGLTPTPTLWEDLVLVSGGFGSKDYFAFEAATGKLVWGIGLDDDGPSNGAVSEGILVFNTESCTIFAVEARSGKPLWSWWMGDPLMSSPAIHNGVVYTAYPARPGKGQSVNSYPVQQNNIDFPAAGPATHARWNPTHVLVALDLHTGEVRWQHWLDGDIMTAPVVEGDEVIASTFSGTLYRFEAKTGHLTQALATRATSAPTLVGQEVFYSRRSEGEQSLAEESITRSSRDGSGQSATAYYSKPAAYLDEQVQNATKLKGQAMGQDAGNGFSGGAPESANWQAAAKNIGLSNVSSLQAFQGSRIFARDGRQYATMGDEVVCSDLQTGDVLWKSHLPGDVRSEGGSLGAPPFLLGNKLVTGLLKGEIMVQNPKTGEVLSRYPADGGIRYQPVAMHGRLFVTTLSGELVCIETGDPELTGWPNLAGNAARTNQPVR
jgi:outer membrane protein assembly factor BamB